MPTNQSHGAGPTPAGQGRPSRRPTLPNLLVSHFPQGESWQASCVTQRIPVTGDWYHQTTAGRPSIEALTGLRWFAALAVCLSHNVPGGKTPLVVATFFSSGYMGVTIFFVLSGFVMTVTYVEAMPGPKFGNKWNYAVARVARVVPLYLLVLFVVILWNFNPAPRSVIWWHVLAIQAWSGNLGVAYSWNGPGWSVGVETFLYAMFPLLILLSRGLTSTRRVVVLALLVVAVMATLLILFHLGGNDQLPRWHPASAHRWLYRSPLMRLGDFLLGICCALIYARERHRVSLVRAAPFVAAAMSMLILVLMAVPQLSLTAPSYDLAYALPGALLILGLALSPDRGIARLLGSVALVALGEASYAFYLVHVPVGAFVTTGRLSNGLTPSSVTVFIVGILFLVVLSWGLHVSFERPARVFLRKRLSISPTKRIETRLPSKMIQESLNWRTCVTTDN
jgi:peptidoglycan/LPS O-acetylase OafA/YrhL